MLRSPRCFNLLDFHLDDGSIDSINYSGNDSGGIKRRKLTNTSLHLEKLRLRSEHDGSLPKWLQSTDSDAITFLTAHKQTESLFEKNLVHSFQSDNYELAESSKTILKLRFQSIPRQLCRECAKE